MATTEYRKLYEQFKSDRKGYLAAIRKEPYNFVNGCMFWAQFESQRQELITDVVYIEGACVETLTLPEFSRAAIMEHSNLTEDELREITHERNAGGGDDATDFTVKHMIDRTIVTVFSSGGEAYFYIGPNSKWLG